MTVYIVFRGSYSDRRTAAVYADRQSAENYIQNAIGRKPDGTQEDDDFDIEEWEVNHGECELLTDRAVWRVDMAKTGETIYLGRESNGHETEDEFHRNYRSATGFDETLKLICYCVAKDDKHAVKIANEKRLMYIANNQWPEKEGA